MRFESGRGPAALFEAKAGLEILREASTLTSTRMQAKPAAKDGGGPKGMLNVREKRSPW